MSVLLCAVHSVYGLFTFDNDYYYLLLFCLLCLHVVSFQVDISPRGAVQYNSYLESRDKTFHV